MKAALVQRPLSGAAVRAPRPAAAAPRRSLSVVAAVKVGDKAPDFALPDQNGKAVKLSAARKPVVLFFYPKDNTPGCTIENKAFRDAYPAFKKAGATVLGVSSDSVESHAGFCSDLGLPFPLLSDAGGKVRAAYGVAKDLLGLLDGRQTYVIDKSGVVVMVHNNQFQPETHVEKALGALGVKA